MNLANKNKKISLSHAETNTEDKTAEIAAASKKLNIFLPKKIPLPELKFDDALFDFKEFAAIDEDQFSTWLSPLQGQLELDKKMLWLLAPNDFVLDYIKEHFFTALKDYFQELCEENVNVIIKVGSKNEKSLNATSPNANNVKKAQLHFATPSHRNAFTPSSPSESIQQNNLNLSFTFDTFVEGKSNQLARAAALQVAANPGKAYNPFFIYGGVGLGKTHLMHAIGNLISKNFSQARVLYLHSERFVADMVKALQRNTIDEFKKFYRSIDALLIDDIQFFAGKERSQEEFFHTFNALFEGQQQIILTSDRYPKEIDGVEERLKSRFGWGLTVAIEPPELETRVAILMSKAERSKIVLPTEVAFFIAKHIHSNVRELEGALKRVIANSYFMGTDITLDFARDALRDLVALRAKQTTIENIQKTVAEYFKIKINDLISKSRLRTLARPRQIAMALAKELTNHSLPEIAAHFGGRDHTTVIHACNKVKELCSQNPAFAEDYKNLLRILSG